MITRILFYCAALLLSFSLAADTSVQSKKLTIALSNDTYPYMFVNQQGQPDGLIVDYWRQVGAQHQFDIDFIMADWPETVALLNEGKVDLHGGMAYTEQRAADYILQSINITIYSNVFVHRDLLRVQTLADLKPYVIGVVQNSSHVPTLTQQLPDVPLRKFATATQLYNAALAGELRAFAGLDRISPQHPGYQELNNQFPLYRKLPLQVLNLVYGLPVNSELADDLKTYTEAVSTQYLNELERKWLGFNVDSEDTLLLGLSVLNRPYMHVTSQGEAAGLLVDLWRLWSEKTGTKIAFVPDNSEDSFASLVNQRIDAHIGFPEMPNVSSQLARAYHIYSFGAVYFTLRTDKQSAPDSSSNASIGIFDSAPYLPELQQLYPNVSFVRYPSLEDITKAMMSGDIVGFFGAEVVMEARLKQFDLWDEFVAFPTSRLFSPLYVWVNQNNPELAVKIAEGFNQITLAELAQIEKKWISSPEHSYFADFKDKIPLTAAERTWLKQNSPLRVGFANNWPPMEFVDKDGNISGVSNEIWQILASRLDIKFDMKPYNNFSEILNDLESRNIDLVANASPQAGREQFALFTEPFWSLQWAVISHLNSENISQASQLRNKRVAIFADYQLARQLNQIMPDINIIEISRLTDGIRLLQENKVDFVLDSLEAGSRALKRENAINLRMQIVEGLPDSPALVAVRSDYMPLVTILNKGLRSIGEKERQQIYQRWFDVEITQGIDRERLHQIIWQVAAVTLLFLTAFMAWNLFLRREVNLRRDAEHKMRYMATHDELTRLPNRNLLKERIDQALEQHSRHNEILAVMFLDLDGFKEVNDIHGHYAGDELLLKLAGLLEGCVRKSDTVARFGGDEFVVLLTALMHSDDAAIVAEKMLYQLSQPLKLSFGEVQVSASIGVAIYPYDATSSSELLKLADKQMYLAKQQGKNGYSFTEREFS